MNDVSQITEKFEKSHVAIAASVSNLGADVQNVKTNVALINQKLDTFINVVNDHATNITYLQTSDTEIRSSFKGAMWIGSILMFAIISLGVYAYTNDIGFLDDVNKEQTNAITQIRESLDKIPKAQANQTIIKK